MGSACCTSDGALVAFAKSHLDEHFGVGTAEALQRIADLLARAEAKLDASMSTPLIVNLGMLLKQVEQDGRHERPPTSGTPFDDAKVLRKAGRFVRFASAASQCNDRKGIAQHVAGLIPDAVKFVQPGDLLAACPGYFIALDHETDDIVLAIRGPLTAAEALREAAGPKVNLLGGRAHGSLLDFAQHVADGAVQTLLRLSQESPRKGIAIVGHSTGGGVAALVTILLSADGCPFAKLMAAGKVKCYCFAPPPVFEPLWALPAWVHGSTYSFVYNMDCVPRACLGTAAKLYMALKHADRLRMSSERRLAYLRGECKLDAVLPDCVDLQQGEAVGTGLTSLFVPGTIVCMYRVSSEDEAVRCESAAPHMLDRLLLHHDMVHDHAVSNFERAFEDLREQARLGGNCVLS